MPEDTNDNVIPLCPSASPELPNSELIGIVGGTVEEPRVAYLSNPQPVTDELLILTVPVHPTEVFRFAAPCACKGCVHFEKSKCKLVERIVDALPEVTETLPPCQIRAECRWWLQEGKAACFRCPQVVSNNYNPSEIMVQAATPASKPKL